MIRERNAARPEEIVVRRDNLAFLQRVADDVVEDYKTIPYATLLHPRTRLDAERTVNGVLVSWNVEIPRKGSNGDICVDIEFHSDLPTILGAKPARSFWKRSDNTIIST